MSQVFITGANRGIGLALTKLYLRDGWDVVACCRTPAQADDLLYLISDNPGLEVYQLDVTDNDAVNELAVELRDRAFDVLINNAGYYGPHNMGLGDLDLNEWRQVIEINTIAPLNIVQAFLPHLKQARGTVVNMTSKMGSMEDNHSGGSYFYRSSKAALNAITKSLSIDLAVYGMKAIVVHPGWVRTEMGGPHGLIDTQQSATGIKQLIDNLDDKQNGGFFDYQGNIIPW